MTVQPNAEPYYAGEGSTGVLFVHGFTGSPHSLRTWAERTAAAGYQVALPRLPGHGTTWQEMAVTSWEDWYACVDRELTALKQSCDKVFLASLSMGGALSLLAAQRRPEDIEALILVNPALHAVNKASALAGVMKYVFPSLKGVGSDIAKPSEDEGAYDRTPLASVHALYKLWSQTKAGLDLVHCPLLIFRSTVDHVVPPASVELIKRGVSSMDIDVIELENSYHVATMDYDAELIFETTLEYLAARA